MPLKYTEYDRLANGHTKGITCLAFSSSGAFLASGGLDGRVCLWSIDSGHLLHFWSATCAVLCCAWSLDKAENTIFCGLRNGSVATLKFTKKEITVVGFWAHNYPVERLAVCSTFIASGAQKQANVWRGDVEPWREEVRLADPPEPPSSSMQQEIIVTGLEWMHHGDQPSVLFAAYMWHGVVLVESETWSRIRVIPTAACIGNASLSPSGKLFAVSDPTNGLELYSLDATGNSDEPVAVLCDLSSPQRLGSPTPVIFVHEGLALLTGSLSREAKLWDVDGRRLHHTLSAECECKVLALAAVHQLHEDQAHDQFIIALGLTEPGQKSSIILTTPVAYDEPVQVPQRARNSDAPSKSWWAVLERMYLTASVVTILALIIRVKS